MAQIYEQDIARLGSGFKFSRNAVQDNRLQMSSVIRAYIHAFKDDYLLLLYYYYFPSSASPGIIAPAEKTFLKCRMNVPNVPPPRFARTHLRKTIAE